VNSVKLEIKLIGGRRFRGGKNWVKKTTFCG